jgi:hypothetical protein
MFHAFETKSLVEDFPPTKFSKQPHELAVVFIKEIFQRKSSVHKTKIMLKRDDGKLWKTLTRYTCGLEIIVIELSSCN